MSKSEEKADAIVLQDLAREEIDLIAELRSLREQEKVAREAREKAEALLLEDSTSLKNPYLWSKPGEQSAVATLEWTRLRAQIDGAVAAHETALRLVDTKEREIERNQVAQERAMALLSQRQNMRVQTSLMVWTAIIALATIVSLFK